MSRPVLSEENIKSSVSRACREVEKNDLNLWDYQLGERAFAHRLAVYLEKYFPEYNVDCEYNKQGMSGDNKNLDNTSNGISADIIVHLRGTNDNNIAHIELKRSQDSRGPSAVQADIQRLSVMKESPKQYKGACFVMIDEYSKKLVETFI